MATGWKSGDRRTGSPSKRLVGRALPPLVEEDTPDPGPCRMGLPCRTPALQCWAAVSRSPGGQGTDGRKVPRATSGASLRAVQRPGWRPSARQDAGVQAHQNAWAARRPLPCGPGQLRVLRRVFRSPGTGPPRHPSRLGPGRSMASRSPTPASRIRQPGVRSRTGLHGWAHVPVKRPMPASGRRAPREVRRSASVPALPEAGRGHRQVPGAPSAPLSPAAMNGAGLAGDPLCRGQRR